MALKDMPYLTSSHCPTINQYLFLQIWRIKIPLHVRIFWWQLRWDHLSAKNLLVHCNIIPSHILNCNIYPMLVEDSIHVLLSCSFAKMCSVIIYLNHSKTFATASWSLCWIMWELIIIGQPPISSSYQSLKAFIGHYLS